MRVSWLLAKVIACDAPSHTVIDLQLTASSRTDVRLSI